MGVSLGPRRQRTAGEAARQGQDPTVRLRAPSAPRVKGQVPVEESVAEGVELAEGAPRVDDERVAWHHALSGAVHDRDEGVGGGLGPDAHPWEVLLDQMPDEGGLARAVLAHQEHHGLVVEVGVLQRGRMELVEAVVLLQGQ